MVTRSRLSILPAATSTAPRLVCSHCKEPIGKQGVRMVAPSRTAHRVAAKRARVR